MLHTIDNLARWSRDYLLTSPSLDEMIQLASQGDNIAQAALCILSKNNGAIINGKYCSISQQRARASITTGIAPPYQLVIIRRGVFDNAQTECEEKTCVEIDGFYVKRIVSQEITPLGDLLTEFLD